MEAIEESIIKSKLVRTLQAFSDFCEANNLRYFAAYGTALGTVRHRGFIPWDDDIDVQMFRADYERLLAIKDQVPAPYKIVDISELGYTGPFAKFMDMSTSHWENKYIHFMFGLYIDIFPLDYCLNDKVSTLKLEDEYKTSINKYLLSLGRYSLADVVKPIFQLKLRTVINRFMTKFYYCHNTHKYYNTMRCIEDKIKNIEENELCFSSMTYVYKSTPFFPIKWFDDVVKMQFESITIPIVKEYDQYLRLLYGDYMQMPPEKDRVSTHYHYYLNLEEGLTIDEAQKRLLEE